MPSGVPDLGARAALALDGLRRLIKRNDAWTDQRLHVLGPAYAGGELDLDGVAQILDLSIPETVARLEECGYTRPPEHVELTEAERETMYRALREDRIARRGEPAPNSTRVVRDVIATQRIEGIDAQPWIDPNLA